MVEPSTYSAAEILGMIAIVLAVFGGVIGGGFFVLMRAGHSLLGGRRS